MGFFDFMKDVGEKIFKPGEARKEDAIIKHMQDNGIDTSAVKVEVDGEKVTITGQVKDIASKEKAVLIAGNIEGIGQVDDQLTALDNGPDFSQVQTGSFTSGEGGAANTGSAEGWSSRTYTVKKGDTLSHIAKEMYGNANEYNKIFEANTPMLKHPDKIYPGQVLRIPA